MFEKKNKSHVLSKERTDVLKFMFSFPMLILRVLLELFCLFYASLSTKIFRKLFCKRLSHRFSYRGFSAETFRISFYGRLFRIICHFSQKPSVKTFFRSIHVLIEIISFFVWDEINEVFSCIFMQIDLTYAILFLRHFWFMFF